MAAMAMRELSQVQVWVKTSTELVDGVFYKLCVGLLLWGVAFAMGIYPIYATSHVFSSGALNAFSGAVFLVGGFVHLFPEAMLQLMAAAADDDARAGSFTAGTILFCATFAGLMVVESLCKHRGTPARSQGGRQDRDFHRTESTDQLGRGPLEETELVGMKGLMDDQAEDDDDEEEALIKHSGSGGPGSSADGSQDEEGDRVYKPANPYVAFVLLASISFHVVMESLALGAMQHVKLVLVIVVALHKAVAAAALGSQLLHSGFPPKQVGLFIVGFASLAPIFIVIGASVRGLAVEESALPAYLTIMGAASFCYVGVVELLVPELCTHKPFSARKVVSLGVGFAAMALLALVE